MKYVVAVSGGIDSVVLLDMILNDNLLGVIDKKNIIVAHFDHGIRDNSSDDARFVELLAKGHQLEFETKREVLGKSASEEIAREQRYKFLKDLANDRQAELVTAHHLDDLVETIVLNFKRGSRWRGLATMSDKSIKRPLLKRTKRELIDYALSRRLEWMEDETNSQIIYRRNSVRRSLANLNDSVKQEIYGLWQRQVSLRQKIDGQITMSPFPISSRHFLIMIDEDVAREIIYVKVFKDLGASLLNKQIDYLLYAIKVGHEYTNWQIGQGVSISLTKERWSMQRGSKNAKMDKSDR